MPKVAIIVSKGFLLKSGYYFRCIRDKKLLETFGCKVDIILLSNVKNNIDVKIVVNPLNIFKIKKILKKYEIVLCENIGASTPLIISSSISLKTKYFLVYHGSLAELRHDSLNYLKKIIFTFNEWFIFKNFTGIFVVSNAFKKLLVKKYGKKVSKKIMVSPNFPDEKFYGNILKARSIDKNILRQNLNLNVKSKIFSYCGNIQPWQNLSYTIDLFVEIYKEDKNSFFLFLSKYKKEIESMIDNRISSDSYRVEFVSNDVMPEYLVASDYLVVIRKQDDINLVACPTKAIEYILSKNKIIVSKNLGDISGYVDESGYGHVIDSTKSPKENSISILNKEYKLDPKIEFISKEIVDKDIKNFILNKSSKVK